MVQSRNSQNKAINRSLINKIDKSTDHIKKIAEYDGKISLNLYLKTQEAKIKKTRETLTKLEEEVSFLQQIQTPLRVGDGFFYSDDYSLATNFIIKKRDGPCNCGGPSNPDGGYDYYVHDFYPQFYFDLKKGEKSILVFIQHKDFDKDEKIVCRRIKGCRGWGEYRDRTKQEAEYVDIKKVFSYLKKKGVKKELINKLERKISEINQY